MRLRFALSALFTAGLGMFGLTHEAAACGACISPPSESTVVTAHRMALSISPKQTVLWDQIEYAGAPGSFAWVLPVKPGAIIQLSTDAWFDTLDATTTTLVLPPQVFCDSDSNFGCGSNGPSLGGPALASDSSSCLFCESEGKGGDSVAPPTVTVVSRGSVGPYSMVTLSTDTPGALNTWLTENGFALDPATQPVVDAYVAEGFDFIALKLLPDKDVRAMKPVRVIQPGANPALPLRMVAIGTGANVALTLFVISEGRWEAQNFENTMIPSSLMAWDFKDDSSNYGELREKSLARNDGATWLTAFAFQKALLSPLPNMGGGIGRMYFTENGLTFSNTIAAAYVRQGISNGDTEDDSCLDELDLVADSSLVVANPCAIDQNLDDPSCGSVKANEIDARALACETLDDVAMAMIGLHPADVWITRLEANLPRSALNKDFLVQAASLQEVEDNLKQAGMGTHSELVCEARGAIGPLGSNGNRSRPNKGNNDIVVLAGFALLTLAALARRRSAFTWRLTAE